MSAHGNGPDKSEQLVVSRTRRLALLLSCTWISLGLASFMGCSALLAKYTTQDTTVAAQFWNQVPSNLFEWQLAGFGAALLLNLLNLQFSYDATRFSCNLLLVYINSVAFLTDWLISQGHTPVMAGATGQMFHPLRYIQWAHTTPTLLVMLSMMSDMNQKQVSFAVVSDVVMIMTGLAASWLTGPWQVVNAVLSFISFLPVLYYVHQVLSSSIRESTDATSKNMLRSLRLFCMLVWSAFPVVWLLGHLKLISPLTEQIGWGVCDYVAKAVFSSQLWQSNLMTIEQRRTLAREAMSIVERVLVVDRLQQLLASKDELVQGLTHDLRAPVQAIIALGNDLIKSSQGAPAASKRNMMAIKSSALCLLNMINATLGAAMARTGELRLNPRPANLVQLVGGVVELIRPLVHDGVSLSNQIPQEIPMVVADRRRLAQVLFNLLGNAIRTTQQGSISITAALNQRKDEAGVLTEAVQVQIKDTGAGIAQANLDKVRHLPGATNTPTSSSDGAGLSLYLMKQFLEAIGSPMQVDSRQHFGTTITFTLPIATGDEINPPDSDEELGPIPRVSRTSQETASPSTPTKRASLELKRPTLDARQPAGDAKPGLAVLEALKRSSLDVPRISGPPGVLQRRSLDSPMTHPSSPSATSMTTPARKLWHREKHGTIQILSVDDDLINQVVAETVLKSQKWSVVKAMNGPAALEHISKAEVLPDLVLLDIMMPGMTGFQVCSKLRETYPSFMLPIMMVSAKSEEEDMVEALNRGADDYITKPYKRNELAARIRAHLRTRDAQRQQQEQDAGWALAHNLLPKDIQRKLREGQTVIWEAQERGAVLRVDVVDLETQASASEASALVVTLNNLVAELDQLCEKHQVVSLDFDGSSYTLMAAPGVTCRVQCEQLLSLAQELMTTTHETQWPGGAAMQLKVGISCGRLLSGVVGSKALKYTVVGEPVAEACLLAAACHPGCICASDQVAAAIMGCDRKAVNDSGPFVPWRQIEGLTGEPVQSWLHRSHCYEDAISHIQKEELEAVLRLESYMSTSNAAESTSRVSMDSNGSCRLCGHGGTGALGKSGGRRGTRDALPAVASSRRATDDSSVVNGAGDLDPPTSNAGKMEALLSALPASLPAVSSRGADHKDYEVREVIEKVVQLEGRVGELLAENVQLRAAAAKVVALESQTAELAVQNEQLRGHISAQCSHIKDLQSALTVAQDHTVSLTKQLAEVGYHAELRELWKEALGLRYAVTAMRSGLPQVPSPPPSVSGDSSAAGEQRGGRAATFFQRFGRTSRNWHGSPSQPSHTHDHQVVQPAGSDTGSSVATASTTTMRPMPDPVHAHAGPSMTNAAAGLPSQH